MNLRRIELFSGSRVMTVHQFGYVALTMINAYCEDGGVIVCRARNQAGEASVSASLNVISTFTTMIMMMNNHNE